MREAVAMMESGRINPAAMITHIGGLCAVVDTTLRLPEIPGGKKLIYTEIDLPLTAITDFRRLSEEGGENAHLFVALADIVERNGGLWCAEAEKFLLAHAKKERQN